MALESRSIFHKTWRTIASIETGVVLLILVVILSAVGTIVLQRPITRPDEMQGAYSPAVLQILDAVGLTDVFHSWWFLGLVFLVSLSIVAASVDRFPNRWRFYSHPYKYPDEGFRRALPAQKSLVLGKKEANGEESDLIAAERALQSRGYRPERVQFQDTFGIFVEQHRISEMAAYIVDASLLLIFLGTIVDGLWGWHGTLNLYEGQSSNIVESRDGKTRALPFSIRCDATGQENYPDGTPKKWWSNLAVVNAGQDVEKKEIVVNDPLLYSGIRFYQSGFGSNGNVEKLVLTATPSNGSGLKQKIGLTINGVAPLDADTTVRFAEFFPDYAIRDNQVYQKSNELRNPLAHLVVTSKKAAKEYHIWLPQLGQLADNTKAPWQFQTTAMKMNHLTQLEVSHEPGQSIVLAGVILMGVGLVFVFYLVHMRLWVVPVRDAKTGNVSLWIGGSANRNREKFEARFSDLVTSIENEVKLVARPAPEGATRFNR